MTSRMILVPLLALTFSLLRVAACGEEDDARGDGASTPIATEDCGDVYIVEEGDVPFSIAEKCGVDVDDLLELNGIKDPTSLFIGQELKVPQ